MRYVRLYSSLGQWHVLDMKDTSFPRLICTCEGYDAWQHVTEVCEAMNERHAKLYGALALTSHANAERAREACRRGED